MKRLGFIHMTDEQQVGIAQAVARAKADATSAPHRPAQHDLRFEDGCTAAVTWDGRALRWQVKAASGAHIAGEEWPWCRR